MVFRGKIRSSIDLPWPNLAKLDLLWGVVAPILAVFFRDTSLFSADNIGEPLIYITASALTTALSFIRFRVSHRVSGFFSVHDAVAVFWASAVGVIAAVVICFL